MEIKIESLEKLPLTAEQFHKLLAGRKKIMLYGEIGAGKTTFVKAFCAFLGVKDAVTSPTFALVNQYIYSGTPNSVKQYIHHLDLYRIENSEEALDIGLEDYLYDDNYCIIEWPGLIEDYIPPEAVKIKIEIIENSCRKIIFL